MWHREDITPSRPYVHVCINGALSLSGEVLVNLLSALLADGKTELGEHLLRQPLAVIDKTLSGGRSRPIGGCSRRTNECNGVEVRFWGP